VIIACRLRELRGERSLRDLEAETGISGGMLSLVEQGRMLPRDRWLSALEAAYGSLRHEWYEPDVLLAVQADPPEKRV
jgi:transcriptional regulator with XRE-family HTH domain